MANAVAYANNDVALIAWSYSAKITNCLGFALYRAESGTDAWEALPAWVGFQGETNPNHDHKTTEVWPIQKFSWKDVTAKRGATYKYKVVPMLGTAGNLTADTSNGLETNEVTLRADHGSIAAYFNRGILSTQFVARQLPSTKSGGPSSAALKDRIDQPGDPLRQALAGQMLDALNLLLERAKKENGRCYLALYELNDPEMVAKLIGNSRISIVLSNTGADDSTNAATRAGLHDSGVDIQDRFVPNGHIGHNKFVVYVDSQGKPKAVQTGSTNWSDTGICAQSNNSIVIESEELASFYFDYWQRLKAQGNEQGKAFRNENNTPRTATVDGKEITLWFSPNTQASTKTRTSATPADMAMVFDLIDKAQQGILFLLFQPGTPSVADEIEKAAQSRPDLFVRGAATDPKVAADFDHIDLYHRGSNPPDTVVPATEVKDQFSFWEKEILKTSGAHAIIHDKIVVIDPFSDEAIVCTGSHNDGYRASYMNDENLLIIRGNRELAQAYAAHCWDVYDHYRWRFVLSKQGEAAFSALDTTDSWQDKYFSDPEIKNEIAFFTGAGGAAPDPVPA
jgi:phosphatidylserine/phosphatidylglycerophosphate/cardiolipin synthase-like enzyme